MGDSIERAPRSSGHPGEVFRAFLRLGLTSFGGPIAHLGYLRTEFVERRRWLDDAQFAQLLAACQFLPGPASSQLGFALGLRRAGWLGALSAFVGFTLLSVILLVAAISVGLSAGTGAGPAVVHGLKLVAVAVVAHGVVQMSRRILIEPALVLIAALAATVILAIGSAVAPLGVIVAGALLGELLSRQPRASTGPSLVLPYGRRAAVLAAGLFGGLLAAALIASPEGPSLGGLAAACYRAGALVFGGGHVVLPLLETSMVGSGWLERDLFLAGYGAAQAILGPMFSVAAYLGAAIATGVPAAVSGLVALGAIFLPGFLVLLAVLPFWTRLHGHPAAQRGMAGIGAAVVGLLAAAFYDPVWRSTVGGPADVAISLVGFALLMRMERAALLVVAWCLGASLFGWWLG